MTVNEFMSKIAVAKAQTASLEEIPMFEAPLEILKYFNPRGLGVDQLTGKEKTDFSYNGVRIFLNGTMEDTLAREEIPATERLHGVGDGTVNRLEGR